MNFVSLVPVRVCVVYWPTRRGGEEGAPRATTPFRLAPRPSAHPPPLLVSQSSPIYRSFTPYSAPCRMARSLYSAAGARLVAQWAAVASAPPTERAALRAAGGLRLTALREASARAVPELSGRALAAVAAGAAAATGGRSPGALAWEPLWCAVEARTSELASRLAPRTLTALAGALAAAGRPPGGGGASLAAAAGTARLDGLPARELARLAWAVGRLGGGAPQFYESLVRAAAPQLRVMRAAQLAALGAAAAGAPDAARESARALLALVASEAVRRLPGLEPRVLASLADSLARAGGEGRALDALAAAAVARADELAARELVQLAAAQPALAEALAPAAAHQLGACAPRELATLARAAGVAARGQRPIPAPLAALLDGVAATAPARLRRFNGQDLAHLLWGFSAAGRAAPGLFRAAADEVAARPADLSLVGLAAVARSLALAPAATSAADDKARRGALAAVGAEATGRLGSASARSIASLAHAYGCARQPAPALFDALAAVTVLRLAEFGEAELAATAWAFAVLDHAAAPTLLREVADEAARRVDSMGPEALANTAWALAAADIRAPAARRFSTALVPRAAELEARFADAALAQLHQWHLWHVIAFGAADTPPIGGDFAERCRDALARRAPEPSMLQRQVGALLHSCGLELRHEVRTREGYLLDFVVEWHGVPLALEVDGPTHFLQPGAAPTGATKLKRRQLREAGWRLVSIPYWELDPLIAPARAGTADALLRLIDEHERTVAACD